MKKSLRFILFSLGLLLLLAVVVHGPRLSAAPVIGTALALPNVIAPGTTTVVTVTIPIPDASVIPGSVNLLQLSASGGQPTILGAMHDDGVNGDAVAGDGIYTEQVTLNSNTTGQVQFEVSAAFRGLLKRVIVGPINIAVTASGTRPLPPDPGIGGMTTLAGIDSDGDGVRDDVERYIALTYPTSTTTRAALTQMAVTMQSELLDATNPTLARADILSWSYAADCLDAVTAASDADVSGLAASMNMSKALTAQVLNTPARTQSYYTANAQLGAFSDTRPPFWGLLRRCLFNPANGH